MNTLTLHDVKHLLEKETLPIFYKLNGKEFALKNSNGTLVVSPSRNKYIIDWTNLSSVLPYILVEKTLEKYYEKKNYSKQ